MTSSHYAIAIIKPDAHRDVLGEVIQEYIQNNGFDIVLRKDIVISPELAKEIYYPEVGQSPNFGAAAESLVGSGKNRLATLLIVKVEEGDAISRFQAVKGKSNQGGIRGRHAQHSIADLLDLGYEGEDVQYMMSENRIHASDSYESAFKIAKMFLTESDLNDLKKREPEFYREIKGEASKEIDSEIEKETKRGKGKFS